MFNNINKLFSLSIAIVIAISLCVGSSCNSKSNSSSTTNTVVTDTANVKPTQQSSTQTAVPDSMIFVVDSTYKISFHNHTYASLEALESVLYDSMVYYKNHSGKVPAVGYHTEGDVLMGMTGDIRDMLTNLQDSVQKTP